MVMVALTDGLCKTIIIMIMIMIIIGDNNHQKCELLRLANADLDREQRETGCERECRCVLCSGRIMVMMVIMMMVKVMMVTMMVKVVMMNMFQDNRREYSIPDLFNKVLSSLTSFSLYFMIVITIIMVMTNHHHDHHQVVHLSVVSVHKHQLPYSLTWKAILPLPLHVSLVITSAHSKY